MIVRRTAALRRCWPFWNWVIWEWYEKTPPEIVAEGLTLRRQTAISRARDLVTEWDRQDAILAGNLRDTAHE